MLVLALVLCFCTEFACGNLSPSNEGRGLPLARAFAKPPNVETDLDCAIKKLAYDYAGNLMTNVRELTYISIWKKIIHRFGWTLTSYRVGSSLVIV